MSPTCLVGTSAIDVSDYKMAYTFTSDGTMSISAPGTLNETILYSPNCFGGDAGAAQACSTFGQNAQQSWQGTADPGATPMNLTKFDCSLDSTQACA